MPDRTARTRIRHAALEFFGRKGIAGTTVQDLAGRARCSQAVLYKYWDGKDALARELFEVAHTELMAAMRTEANRWSDPSERVLGAAFGFLRYARERPAEHALLFQVFHSDYARWLARMEKPSDLMKAEIEAGMKSGQIPQGPAMVKAALILGMAIRLAVFEHQGLIVGAPEAGEAELAGGAAAVLGV